MVYNYFGRRNTTNAFVPLDLGFVAHNIIIVNSVDNSEDIQLSFDGTNYAGEIAVGEPLTLAGIEARFLYIKSASGGMEYRLWAWA